MVSWFSCIVALWDLLVRESRNMYVCVWFVLCVCVSVVPLTWSVEKSCKNVRRNWLTMREGHRDARKLSIPKTSDIRFPHSIFQSLKQKKNKRNKAEQSFGFRCIFIIQCCTVIWTLRHWSDRARFAVCCFFISILLLGNHRMSA